MDDVFSARKITADRYKIITAASRLVRREQLLNGKQFRRSRKSTGIATVRRAEATAAWHCLGPSRQAVSTATMINCKATTSDVRATAEAGRRRIDRRKCETVISQIVRPGGGDSGGRVGVAFRTISRIYWLGIVHRATSASAARETGPRDLISNIFPSDLST